MQTNNGPQGVPIVAPTKFRVTREYIVHLPDPETDAYELLVIEFLDDTENANSFIDLMTDDTTDDDKKMELAMALIADWVAEEFMNSHGHKFSDYCIEEDGGAEPTA